MEICGNCHTFTPLLEKGEIDIVATIRVFREHGLRAVEFSDAFVGEERLVAVKAVLAELEVALVCYDVVCDFATADAAARQAETAKLQAGIRRAAALGARYVLTYPGFLKDGLSPADVRRWFAEGVRDSLPLARRSGITVTIPDVGIQAALCGTSAHLNEICDAVGPDLRVTYDVGNFVMAGEDPLEAFDRVAPRIVHAHIKDWQILPASANPPPGAFVGLDGRYFVGAVPGDGVLDLHGMIARLSKLGYQGYLSYEYEGTGDPWEAVRRGLAYLRRLL